MNSKEITLILCGMLVICVGILGSFMMINDPTIEMKAEYIISAGAITIFAYVVMIKTLYSKPKKKKIKEVDDEDFPWPENTEEFEV